MKIYVLAFLSVISVCRLSAQDPKILVLNDSTELYEYESGQKLKVNYRLNDRLISVKEKNKLIEIYTQVKQDFNIKTVQNETAGEINFYIDEELVADLISNPAAVPTSGRLDLLKPLKGVPFPVFSWVDINGEAISLRQLEGKVIVFNFWHTSCIPCIAEMPLLNELVKKYGNKDVVFISSTPNNNAELINFFKKNKFMYRQVPSVDPKSIFEPFPGWPIHIVLDRNGKIQFSAIGKQAKIEEKLIKHIEEALGR